MGLSKPQVLGHLFLALLFLPGLACRPGKAPPPETRPLRPMGFSIQAGAFSDFNNALLLTEDLREKGLDAFFFADKRGLYKVHFGNFPSGDRAAAKAADLKDSGIINEYYIVEPEQYPDGGMTSGRERLRKNLVKTAKGFIGIPYHWSGESSEKGFDCSGLTMAVYRLNGLDMPRTVREQWTAGVPVAKGSISGGDLVFFSANGVKKTSHVGLYDKDGRFIHSPGAGKVVQMGSLSSPYYRDHFTGARTYLGPQE